MVRVRVRVKVRLRVSDLGHGVDHKALELIEALEGARLHLVRGRGRGRGRVRAGLHLVQD